MTSHGQLGWQLGWYLQSNCWPFASPAKRKRALHLHVKAWSLGEQDDPRLDLFDQPGLYCTRDVTGNGMVKYDSKVLGTGVQNEKRTGGEISRLQGRWG